MSSLFSQPLRSQQIFGQTILNSDRWWQVVVKVDVRSAQSPALCCKIRKNVKFRESCTKIPIQKNIDFSPQDNCETTNSQICYYILHYFYIFWAVWHGMHWFCWVLKNCSLVELALPSSGEIRTLGDLKLCTEGKKIWKTVQFINFWSFLE